MGPTLMAEEIAPSPASPDQQINRWISQLDSDKYVEREAASAALRNLGSAAIRALAEAATSNAREVSRRAMDLLAAMAESADPQVRQAAHDALQRVADAGNTPASRHAASILNPPPDQIAQQGIPQFQGRVFPGGRVQIAGGIQLGGQGVQQIQIRNANGQRKIAVQKKDLKIEIQEDQKNGITMKVVRTVAGKPITKNYQARDAAELRKKHPEAAQVYDQYAGKAKAIEIRVQPFGLPVPIPQAPLPNR